MKNNFLIEMLLSNYDKNTYRKSQAIKLEEIYEYKELINIINKNVNNQKWNWFSSLPETWDGKMYIPDTFVIETKFKENFGVDMTVNRIIKFYKRFTPNGADNISEIKLYKVEELDINNEN